MKTSLLYVVSAMVVGAAAILFPWLMITFTTATIPNAGNSYGVLPDSLSKGFQKFDDSVLITTQGHPTSGLEMFAISLAAATIAYLLFKHRIAH